MMLCCCADVALKPEDAMITTVLAAIRSSEIKSIRNTCARMLGTKKNGSSSAQHGQSRRRRRTLVPKNSFRCANAARSRRNVFRHTRSLSLSLCGGGCCRNSRALVWTVCGASRAPAGWKLQPPGFAQARSVRRTHAVHTTHETRNMRESALNALAVYLFE